MSSRRKYPVLYPLTLAGTGVRAPQLLSVSPVSGPAAGGTAVTITGRWFDSYGATAPSTLNFGTGALTAVTVVNDTTITGTTANMGAAGAKLGVIINNNGTDRFGNFFTATA